MILIDLPPELIHLIADHLNVKDLSAFILTSCHLASLLDPILQDRALTYRCSTSFHSDLSVFELAAGRGKEDTLQKLLMHAQRRGLEIPQGARDRALYFAACNDDDDLLEFLVKVARADMSAIISNGRSKAVAGTPLHWAVKEGNEAAVQKLIQLGANVNAVDERQLSVLHLAVAAEDHNLSTAIAKLLLENGAMTEAKCPYGETPLHKAAAFLNTMALKLLLDYGADIMARDNEGTTALHYAIECDDFESVVLLVKRGSDLDATDNAGRSARELALLCFQGCGNCELCEFIQSHCDVKDDTKH
ncbi:uncharacterized protein CDV56_107135 [Aspergillus thermomutatus]|uniref:Uncharacterized protein n=1 Tax=Aspergillus thermomutatus TaxID=41047 RepID=A0A397HEK6_ASPTH|nr:uncharacterized protein CDV56_107135 [Aspergillus thermomutatus]RHZ60004.1 hypothetical protein CDV56_107135 [Aspergillus thermomutatus]